MGSQIWDIKYFSLMGFWEYQNVLHDVPRGSQWSVILFKIKYTGYTEALLRHNKIDFGLYTSLNWNIFSIKNTKKWDCLVFWNNENHHLLEILILLALNIILQNVHYNIKLQHFKPFFKIVFCNMDLNIIKVLTQISERHHVD